MNILELSNISKSYTLLNREPLLIKQIFFSSRPKKTIAIKDLSLKVKKGEMIGIIGENGSGKSTLLKIITGITYPDKGEIKINGRVCSLIELGAGFHQDLTGRENIFLNGILLGFSRKDLEKNYQSIIDFADIGEYINHPVRTYSTGMALRLGFAVAAHLDPELLLVDEVLAVGDEDFQRKCLDKIELLRLKKCTIIFVSHNLPLVEAFSDKVVWMKNGVIQKIGKPPEVISSYLKYIDSTKNKFNSHTLKSKHNAPIYIKKLLLFNSKDNRTEKFTYGEQIKFRIVYQVNQLTEYPVFGIILHNQLGLPLHWSNTRMAKKNIKINKGEGSITYVIKNLFLLPGRYLISLGVHNSKETQIFDWKNRFFSFEIMKSDLKQGGYIGLSSDWRE